jgi:hypothetical protein
MATSVGRCATELKKAVAQIQSMPCNCPTTDCELRVLESEKRATLQRIGASAATADLIGLVGLVTTPGARRTVFGA